MRHVEMIFRGKSLSLQLTKEYLLFCRHRLSIRCRLEPFESAHFTSCIKSVESKYIWVDSDSVFITRVSELTNLERKQPISKFKSQVQFVKFLKKQEKQHFLHKSSAPCALKL